MTVLNSRGSALQWISGSPEETEEMGGEVGAHLEAGDVVGLVGELGAGKTLLVRGLSRGLGVSGQGVVRSPTFTLIHEYPGRVPVYHMDFYRMGSPQELHTIGWEEYCAGSGVVLIEWAERAGAALPADRLTIELEVIGERERRLTLVPSGARFHDLVRRLPLTHPVRKGIVRGEGKR